VWAFRALECIFLAFHRIPSYLHFLLAFSRPFFPFITPYSVRAARTDLCVFDIAFLNCRRSQVQTCARSTLPCLLSPRSSFLLSIQPLLADGRWVELQGLSGGRMRLRHTYFRPAVPRDSRDVCGLEVCGHLLRFEYWMTFSRELWWWPLSRVQVSGQPLCKRCK